MRLRFLLSLLVCAAFFPVTGCERTASSPFTAEIDEPNYRRGKDLLKQGRNQEALNAFLKVVQERGDDAPESHLEIGILFQYHIKDPIAAIYHYRKFRELKPNSPQAELVRQRIDAATREFAKTLPGSPLENRLELTDNQEALQRLQRENAQLKEQLALARGRGLSQLVSPPLATTDYPPANPPPLAPATTNPGRTTPAPAGGAPEESIFTRAPLETATDPEPASASAPATVPTPVRSGPQVTTPQPPARPVPSGRRHVVAPKENLYSISRRYYGTNARWRDIYTANRDVMKSETDLKIGMELKIP